MAPGAGIRSRVSGELKADQVTARLPRRTRRGTPRRSGLASRVSGGFPEADAWVSSERPDFTTDIPRISLPMLPIWGDQDPHQPRDGRATPSRTPPESSLRVFAGGTHSLANDRLDEVAALVMEHLDGPRW